MSTLLAWSFPMTSLRSSFATIACATVTSLLASPPPTTAVRKSSDQIGRGLAEFEETLLHYKRISMI